MSPHVRRLSENTNILVQKVEKAKIDGLILQNIRFCDLHGAENGLFESDLEARGILCMRLEREYGPLVETGRMRICALTHLLKEYSREGQLHETGIQGI